MVVAEILDFPTHVEQATGRVVKRHRYAGRQGHRNRHRDSFARNSLQVARCRKKQVQGFGATVPDASMDGRTELRNVDLITIDGADARDFDDAVYC